MKRILLVLFLLFFWIGTVSASPIYYTDRSAFNAAAGSLNFESFEVAPSGPQASFSFSGFTVEETNGTNALTNVLINSAFGTYPVTNGSGALWYDDNDNSIGVFTFASPITAFGLDLTTALNSSITIGGDLSTTLNRTSNTPAFFGVIDTTPFTTITFNASGGPEVGFDAVSFGTTSVPEPITMLLLGVGLVGLAATKRMRS